MWCCRVFLKTRVFQVYKVPKIEQWPRDSSHKPVYYCVFAVFSMLTFDCTFQPKIVASRHEVQPHAQRIYVRNRMNITSFGCISYSRIHNHTDRLRIFTGYSVALSFLLLIIALCFFEKHIYRSPL